MLVMQMLMMIVYSYYTFCYFNIVDSKEIYLRDSTAGHSLKLTLLVISLIHIWQQIATIYFKFGSHFLKHYFTSVSNVIETA